ncbi:MAG: ribulose-phosphate 3-epimerase [bacterium]
MTRGALEVSPSVLAADFARLGEEIARVEPFGVRTFHLDVMDGRFVPNISFGPFIVEAINRLTTARLETHLMVAAPEHLLEAFASAGSDQIAVHVEPRAVIDVGAALARIRALGVDAALALNPETPVESVFPHLEGVAQILVMSVSPGFGGQAFIPSALAKIESLARVRAERGLGFRIGVDGGVNPVTGPQCVAAGADLLVAGTAVFRAPDPAAAIRAIRGA